MEETNKAICVECKEVFDCDSDIQLCDKCIEKFDLERLWRQHDKGLICALDFNENEKFREKYKK